jgi:two-component system chemotaxis sensor kinase CheA
VGLLVDDLLGQQQAVVKSLEAHYQRVQGISGATILSDGSVALIVDVSGVVRLGQSQGQRRKAA